MLTVKRKQQAAQAMQALIDATTAGGHTLALDATHSITFQGVDVQQLNASNDFILTHAHAWSGRSDFAETRRASRRLFFRADRWVQTNNWLYTVAACARRGADLQWARRHLAHRTDAHRVEGGARRLPQHVLGHRSVQRHEQHSDAHRLDVHARDLRPGASQPQRVDAGGLAVCSPPACTGRSLSST